MTKAKQNKQRASEPTNANKRTSEQTNEQTNTSLKHKQSSNESTKAKLIKPEPAKRTQLNNHTTKQNERTSCERARRKHPRTYDLNNEQGSDKINQRANNPTNERTQEKNYPSVTPTKATTKTAACNYFGCTAWPAMLAISESKLRSQTAPHAQLSTHNCDLQSSRRRA